MIALIGGAGVLTCLKRHIDVSLSRVFAAPVLALIVSAICALYLFPVLKSGATLPDLAIKTTLTTLTYLTILWIAEKRYLLQMWGEMRQIMSDSEKTSAST